ncbi:hypothetical protein [Cytobacillus gottheilii]|uniref:Uncharacterized protein n=1 Tax=Cytobacillus gottheilii TaxID=859144 RepID=A0ABX8FF86_9BACI|nr:hypothetical protein [Cytobacillus gottheilii]QVY62693.1 hypothetical protein J1899_06460 [Cytobacillus gottheilii]
MTYFFNFLLAIFLTASSYFIGSILLKNSITILAAIIIGASVVSLGSITEKLGAPIWLIVLVPFPVGMTLLYLFLKEPFHIWLITYMTTLALYTVIHVIMSYFFKFNSLIPAWKLRV